MNEPSVTNLESALARSETDADVALRAVAAVTRELRTAKSAAAQGAIRDLQRSIAAAEQMMDALRDGIGALRSGWRFDEQVYLESGAYTAELLEIARERGVRLFEQDERILSYPSLVRLLPADAALEIDRKRFKRIRPSAVAEHLRALQHKQPRFKAAQFLEALFRAYELAVAEKHRKLGSVVRLLDVYQILTLFPGQRSDYSKPEFARDLYLLDQSDVRETRGGRKVSFPAATGTKSAGTLSTVTREGEVKAYYGIAFRP
ncbi:MAG: hypothetical protein HY704_05660 [Gemmatimonadetes bacterium]|nr:hypothetical protein [Gemmatimonadota bacterium]